MIWCWSHSVSRRILKGNDSWRAVLVRVWDHLQNLEGFVGRSEGHPAVGQHQVTCHCVDRRVT